MNICNRCGKEIEDTFEMVCIENYGDVELYCNDKCYEENDEMDVFVPYTLNQDECMSQFVFKFSELVGADISAHKDFINVVTNKYLNEKMKDGYIAPKLLLDLLKEGMNDDAILEGAKNTTHKINKVFYKMNLVSTSVIEFMRTNLAYGNIDKEEFKYFLDEPFKWTSKATIKVETTNVSSEEVEKSTKANTKTDNYIEDFEPIRGNRYMPMGKRLMNNKDVDAEFYGKLQLGSEEFKTPIKVKGKNLKERYIEDMNISQFAKEFGVSRPTFYKKVQALEDEGIVERIDVDGDTIYKLPIFKDEHYTLISYNTLTELTNVFNSDAIKIYMVCNAFCNSKISRAIQTREQLLEQLGYEPTRKLLQKVDDIIKALAKSEFIEINKSEEVKVNKKKSIRYTIKVLR